MLTASLVKGKRMNVILVFLFLGNVFIATSYLVAGGGINGAAAGYLGSVQAIINYFFDSKNKPIPKWLIAVYIISNVSLNLWVAQGITALSLIVIMTGLAFVMSIIQPNGTKYRFWALLNLLLWCIYDVASTSYSVLLTHAFQLIVTVLGMIIHDRKGAGNANTSED